MKLRYLLFCTLLLAACATTRGPNLSMQPWQFRDLRLLTQPRVNQNNNAIIAAYLRVDADDLQFRLDLLDIQPDDQFDVFLLLDDEPGVQTSTLPGQMPTLLEPSYCQGWDWLFIIPHDQHLQTYKNGYTQPVDSVIARLQRDPIQDTLTISLNRNLIKISPRLNFQIFLAKPGGKVMLDQTPCLSNDLSQPFSTAPLLIEFSNTFNAFTPAQALRQWDGAHTGPSGERHGLEHILTNAFKFRIPIVLLDLKEPTNLTALDYIGGMTWIRQLERRGLLLLPDLGYSSVTRKSLALSRSSAVDFQVKGSQFVYSPFEADTPGFPYQFQKLNGTHHLLRLGSKNFIPLPETIFDPSAEMVTAEDLSLKARRELLEIAFSPDPSDFLVLGGDLDQSYLGDAATATLVFSYISNHPWMQPMNEDALKSLGSIQHEGELTALVQQPAVSHVYNSQGELLQNYSFDIQKSLLNSLDQADPNQVTDSAWSLYLSLTEPTTDQSLADLRAQYLFLVKDLLLASQWVAHPWESYDCSLDVDGDLQPECLLTSQNYFSLFELNGGSLTLFFVRDGNQIHQVIGPTSQLAVGLSDPSRWNVRVGPLADPSLIPGAFVDSADPAKTFKMIGVNPGSLSLKSFDGSESKSFSISASTISIAVNSNKPIDQIIPLVLDPQSRNRPGWGNQYHGNWSGNVFYWGLAKSIELAISTTGSLNTNSFIDSKPSLLKPEDPNFDYPAGHFLPFPLARVEITGIGSVSTTIQMEH